MTFTPKSSVSKRLVAYLPDVIFDKLEEWSNEERRSISNLTAFLLEQAVREREKTLRELEQNKHKENT